MAEDHTIVPPSDGGDKPGFPARLFRRATHEQLACPFVPALYATGMPLTAPGDVPPGGTPDKSPPAGAAAS